MFSCSLQLARLYTVATAWLGVQVRNLLQNGQRGLALFQTLGLPRPMAPSATLHPQLKAVQDFAKCLKDSVGSLAHVALVQLEVPA